MSVSCSDFFELYWLLKLLNDEMNHYLTKHRVRLGLSASEFQILWIVSLSNGATFLEIARLTGQTKKQIQEIVVSLEADGLVQRICHKDSRLCTIAATLEGNNLIDELSVIVDRMRIPLEGVTSQEVQELLRTLRQLVEALKGTYHLERMKHIHF